MFEHWDEIVMNCAYRSTVCMDQDDVDSAKIWAWLFRSAELLRDEICN